MRSFRLLPVLPALALALVLSPARDAEACGGCFHVPGESTQVASHRMIPSVSQQQSTLYDEIKYAGSPSSFAWVLPVKGTVTIGLSSDALFAQIDQLTAVTVNAPNLPCPPCNSSGFSASSSSGGGGVPDGGVTVVSQMVVGPYEEVQLSSSNPTALTDWLAMHGYAIPADVQPIISAYVAEGFDFLALKLVPGASVSEMQPVRVTTPGASPVLPLRMVAAGVGAMVPINLFVVGEGRYEPTNFPWFAIDPNQLVWDFSVEKSNYDLLRQTGFTATGGKGWLVESANPFSEQLVTQPLLDLAMFDPQMSGYADSMGMNAPMNAQQDMDTLFTGISPASLWITRLLAELPRTALSIDLTVGAAASQTPVPTNVTPPKYVNAPPCPCGGTTSAGVGGSGATSGNGTSSNGVGGAGGSGGVQGSGGSGNIGQGSSCSALPRPPADERPALFTFLLAALAFLAPRRRR